MKTSKERKENRMRKVRGKKKNIKEVKKITSPLYLIFWAIEGFPRPHCSLNYQRWISTIIY